MIKLNNSCYDKGGSVFAKTKSSQRDNPFRHLWEIVVDSGYRYIITQRLFHVNSRKQRTVKASFISNHAVLQVKQIVSEK